MLAFRPRSVASSTAWAREPRFIGSGSGLTRRGASRPSTSQRTPQAANVSSWRAPSVRRAASCSSTGARERRGQRRRVGLHARRGLRAAQLARGRRLARRPRHLGEQPPPALGPQLVGEQRAHVVEERRGDQRLALLVGRAPGQEQHLLGARDAGVEQRALTVEHVLVQRQPQPRGGGEPAPRVVVEERLGHRPPRELCVLQPAHEDGAEAPRADLERVGEQHALGRVALAHLDRRQRLEHVLGAAQQCRIAGREPAQLPRRRPQLGGDARLVALVGVEQVGAAHVRGRPDRVRLGDERGQQRLPPSPAAEVRGQQPHALLAERGAALAEDRHVGVAEAVDRLELVADREQVVALERLEHVELEPVRVLELVDHDQREALRPALPVLGVGGEQVAHAELEVLEVEPRALRLGLRVARAEAREQHRDLLERGAGVVVGAALAVGVERGCGRPRSAAPRAPSRPS